MVGEGERADEQDTGGYAEGLDEGFADVAQGERGQQAAGGERCPEEDDARLAVEECGVREAQREGGEPAGKAGFEAAVEEEQEREDNQGALREGGGDGGFVVDGSVGVEACAEPAAKAAGDEQSGEGEQRGAKGRSGE